MELGCTGDTSGVDFKNLHVFFHFIRKVFNLKTESKVDF